MISRRSFARRLSRGAALLVGLAAGLLALRAPLAADEAPKRPNIVFILADDLGYGDLGCYGQKHTKTPNLDRLAADGMRFTQYYAGSAVCAPSRCVLLTGRHPGHAFIRSNSDPGPASTPHEIRGQIPLPADARTLADQLKTLGYATAGFGKWGLGGPGSTGDPLRHGFDHFLGYLDQYHAHNHYPRFIFHDGQQLPLDNPAIPLHQKLPEDAKPDDPASYRRFVGHDYVPDRLAEAALRFIDEHAGEPFFLYYPTTIPHMAMQVPEDSLAEYQGQWPDPPYPGGHGYSPHVAPRAAYAAMITRMDRDIGRLLASLADHHLAEQTIVVFTSDNGAQGGAVGGGDVDFFQSAGSLRGLKGSLYEGGVRVPCIVRWTGHVPAGVTSDFVVGAEDWFPTLLDLVGEKDRLPAGLDGIDIAPTLLGQKQPPRPFLYREFPDGGGQQSVRIGNWKAIRAHLMPGGKQGAANLKIQLYDLATDASETHDVAREHPDLVAEAERVFAAEHSPSAEFPSPALDPK
ncbi:MAG TPA: arylsulfatase [Pirellulales bacterium]|nr:arylsulfatase [Pirellulales bacterium]